MKDEKKVTHAIYLGLESIKRDRIDDGSGRAELRIVEVNTETKEIRNGLDSEFNDLVLYCQWNGKFGAEPFAFTAEYRDAYIVGLSRAKQMVKMLKRVEKVEGKFPVIPTTFGQWCVLLGRGLGLTMLAKQVSGSGSYSDMEHRFFRMNEAQYIVDTAIDKARKVEVAA
jgi:hypothetical protein